MNTVAVNMSALQSIGILRIIAEFDAKDIEKDILKKIKKTTINTKEIENDTRI